MDDVPELSFFPTAELIIRDCCRVPVLLKLTTDRHEASHGLSATAVLLLNLATVSN